MYVYSASMQSFAYIWNVFIRRPETLFCSVSAAQIMYTGNVYIHYYSYGFHFKSKHARKLCT